MEALGSDSAFFYATILIGAIMTAAERFWRYLMPDPQVESLDDYERRMFGMLNKELAEQSVHQKQFTAQLDRMHAAWQPVPAQTFAGYAAYLRRWVDYCDRFRPAADWLTARIRPALATRIAAIRADCATAAAGYEQMAQSASATATGRWKAQTDANREAFEALVKMNRDLQATFDASNEAWLKNFRG
jgi:hypothetical protein